MTNSMTAFTRTESSGPLGDFSLELRSVNHRYLEMVFRLPEELRRFEPRFRDLISSRLSRGRVDANIRFTPREMAKGVTVNPDGVAQLATAAGQVRDAIPGIGELRVIDVLGWPGIIDTPPVEADKLGEAAEAMMRCALDELSEIREREGAGLQNLIGERLDAISAIVDDLRPLRPEIEANFRQRLADRIGALREEVDADRFEQEVVLFLQKSDTDEELDRLMLHVEEVRRVLGEAKPIGRRLDFLMQELNREANTLGSKAADARITRAGVDLKVLIEQMREQVQNIE